MTNTRRSLASSSQRDVKEEVKVKIVSPEKLAKSPSRKRKPVDEHLPAEDAGTSRPKRNARKSVLLSSADFEVSYPGVKVEEPDQDQPATSSHSRAKKVKQEPLDRSDVEVDVDICESSEGNEHSRTVLTDIGPNIDVEAVSNADDGLEEDMMITLKEYSDGDYEEENDDQPPLLEKVSDVKRKRGRPRKYPEGQAPFRRTAARSSSSKPGRQSTGQERAQLPRNKYIYEKPITKNEAEKINSFNVKLFDDEIGVTENGDCYATVIPGCLSYLLRKERIIELLTNRNEINNIRTQGWFSRKPPRLPPLVDKKACFAFYVDGTAVTNVRDLSSDDLKPWSSSVVDPAENDPVIKPNVRKHAIMRQGARLVPSKGDPRSADIHLTEYSAWLPRCTRLRKKIFYLARNGHIIGNVVILYDFTQPGDVPVLLNIVNGNEAFRSMTSDEEFEKGHLLFVGDNEDPFLEDIVRGPRGENYLQVHPEKYGWTNNKKLLLRYLINDPSLQDQARFLNSRIPYLPPLVETRGVFVHFVPAALVADQIHFTGDGLSPWTFQGATVNHRVRTVKRALIQDSQGVFQTSKDDWHTTGLALVETITILCRCPRLRKRILYIQKNNTVIIGIVCFIYEYMREGPAPDIIKANARASSGFSLDTSSMMHRDIPSKKSVSITAPGENGEEEVDVEELVEEEVVQDDMHEHPIVSRDHLVHDEYEDLPEDSLDSGWDTEFEEDLLTTHDAPEPFFDGIRQLEGGHTYLTVRHKRVASNLETVLEYIANTNFVDDKGLVNQSKPSHPPLVRNARAYVFFVASNVIFAHDVNRDDFSPWSANATPENPTCYRSKVRKVGVLCDPKTGRFNIQDGDYKMFPYHIVALYSIHPKEARLRKRITYLMDTASKLIISHVMIMYDYNTEGPLPHVNGPYGKRFVRRRIPKRMSLDMAIDEVIDDVSDDSESEKETPFEHGPQQNSDGTIYLPLADLDFINDRNRQLHYLINKPHLLDAMECLNPRVPMFPPLISGKGAFVFFVDGNEVDVRNLTCDGLAPWSENMHMSDGTIMCRRPKTHRIPLALNRNGQLRVIRGRRPSDATEYTMHVYAATLPRLQRLKKRVLYISKDGEQLGHSLIMYWYSEEGDVPQPVSHGNSVHTDSMYIRLPPSVREDARRLLLTMAPQDVAKELTEKHGIPVNTRAIYNVKRELARQLTVPAPLRPMMLPRYEVKMESTFDVEDSLTDYVPEWLNDASRSGKNSLVQGGSMDVGHTEEVSCTVRSPSRHLRKNLLLSTGQTPRAHQSDQVFRYVRGLLGTSSDTETFDAIWRTLLQKNEQRILHNIKHDFGVEIVAENVQDGDAIEVAVDGSMVDTSSMLHEQILEGDIVEEVVNEEDIVGEVVYDTTMEDAPMNILPGGETIVEQAHVSDEVDHPTEVIRADAGSDEKKPSTSD